MRVILQRVSRASVSWTDEAGDGRCEEIGRGLAILLGAGPEDDASHADRLAAKVAQLRIFPDANGRFNLSLEDVSGAAPPDAAHVLCQRFADQLAERGITTRTGSFGAHMTVSLDNDGPVTIALSTEPWETRITG